MELTGKTAKEGVAKKLLLQAAEKGSLTVCEGNVISQYHPRWRMGIAAVEQAIKNTE